MPARRQVCLFVLTLDLPPSGMVRQTARVGRCNAGPPNVLPRATQLRRTCIMQVLLSGNFNRRATTDPPTQPQQPLLGGHTAQPFPAAHVCVCTGALCVWGSWHRQAVVPQPHSRPRVSPQPATPQQVHTPCTSPPQSPHCHCSGLCPPQYSLKNPHPALTKLAFTYMHM